MKTLKAAIVFIVVVLGIGASTAVLAHRGGARFGVFVGGPAFWYYSPYYYPPYYYSPYDPYYYPRTVVVPAAPPVYIEQNPPPAAPAPSSYWYYCSDSGAYYPNVSQCATPWQRVAPRPPS